MKKLVLVAAAAALISAPAFAAPEAYNVDINNGQLRASPPSSNSETQTQGSISARPNAEAAMNSQTEAGQQAQQGNATWTRAEAPSSPSAQQNARMVRTSDEGTMKPKKKHHHKKKKMDSTAPEAPKAAPEPQQPAGQGQQ